MPWIIFTMTFFIGKTNLFIFSFFGKSTSPGKERSPHFPGNWRFLTRKFSEVFRFPTWTHAQLAAWSAQSRNWKCRNHGGTGEGESAEFPEENAESDKTNQFSRHTTWAAVQPFGKHNLQQELLSGSSVFLIGTKKLRLGIRKSQGEKYGGSFSRW